jgi:hypothetical protein
MKKLFRVCLCSVGVLLAGQAFSEQTCLSTASPENPDSAYSNITDETVVHVNTGLMWSRCPMNMTYQDFGTHVSCANGSNPYLSWKSALVEASTSGYADFTDWRIPSIAELRTLVDLRCINPPYNEDIFPDSFVAETAGFWSSTTVASEPSMAWAINPITGKSIQKSKTSDAIPTFLVRDATLE